MTASRTYANHAADGLVAISKLETLTGYTRFLCKKMKNALRLQLQNGLCKAYSLVKVLWASVKMMTHNRSGLCLVPVSDAGSRDTVVKGGRVAYT
ncbi:hypothetical protein BaRGS_00036540, partial [Batillaria attramentaria]